MITVAIILLISTIYNAVSNSQYTQTTWSDFRDAMEAGNLSEVEIRHDRVVYMTREEADKEPREQRACFTGLPATYDQMTLANELDAMGVKVDKLIVEDNSAIIMILYYAGMLLLSFFMIRLLMKRPKTTMLTLTALILVVTVIVGCTFSAAPATEQPDITPTPPAETTAPTGHVPDNDMAYEGQELPIPDSLAPITAAYADASFRPDYAYHSEETEYITSIAFTPNEVLKDVQFGLLEWQETGSLWMADVLHTIDELSPDQSFLAQVPFWGDLTTYGISFIDETGRERHFSVLISGEDGSLILREF